MTYVTRVFYALVLYVSITGNPVVCVAVAVHMQAVHPAPPDGQLAPSIYVLKRALQRVSFNWMQVLAPCGRRPSKGLRDHTAAAAASSEDKVVI